MQMIDRLLETPCYIIDFLPKQVPNSCVGQFLKVENYFLNEYERYGIRDRFIRILLKTMCYYPVSVNFGEWIEQPEPAQVARIIDTIMENHSGDMSMTFTGKDVLLQFGWDCLNINISQIAIASCNSYQKRNKA